MPHRIAVVSETLTGTRTITAAECGQYWSWYLDPGGAARTVVLPAAAACEGQQLFLVNMADASEWLTVVESDTTTVAGYIVPGAGTLFTSSGSLFLSNAGSSRRSPVLVETLADARVLTAAEVLKNPVIVLDPGGSARNVDLPATSYLLAGTQCTLINSADAAETITVRLTGAGATVATVDQNEHVILTCYSATAGSWVGSVGKAT